LAVSNKKNKRYISEYDKYHYQLLKLLKKNIKLATNEKFTLTIDHIHPFNGDTVCGFDCYQNLILVTPEFNLKKANKLLPETCEMINKELSMEDKIRVAKLFDKKIKYFNF